MLVLFGGLTVLCAFVASYGQPIGFIGVLFFGGGGAVYLYLEHHGRARSGRGPGDARVCAYHGTLPGAGRHTSHPVGVVFPAERGPVVAATVGSAVFVLVGAAFVVYGGVEGRIIGAACVLVFGFFGLFGLAGSLSRHRGVALLPEGVYCRMPAGTAWLPWEAIGRVWVVRIQTQASVALRADPPGAITLTGPNIWLRGINRRWFSMDVAYPARNSRELCAAIRRYARDSGARSRLVDPAEVATARE
jgi:hypothetical protein